MSDQNESAGAGVLAPDRLFIGGAGADHKDAQSLLLKYGNRHGLIAGATGTGKTVTLQILAEGFSKAGVPVFLSDVKGDLSGLAASGSPEHKLHDKLVTRATTIGLDDYGYDPFPVVFWDLFGEQGHPIRTTISDLGPLMLSRLLDLNETQEGVLNVVFRCAEDEGLPLLDLKDLRAMLTEVANKATSLSVSYGNVSAASVGAIQRRLLILENQGGDMLFGEPALKLEDMIQVGRNGEGQVNILAADKLMQSPRLYATFLLWLMSELFEKLPEIGDPDKPVMAFFFDEAHLLFNDAPKALIEKVEQVARLIRSKGVGVYFISQSPTDIPDTVLGQLGNRVQHALRAFTPRDQKALRAAADTFRPNPEFDTQDTIPALGVGEALVSTLEAKGAPSMVARTLIRPPSSRLGPIERSERDVVIQNSPVAGIYEQAVDRHSALEELRDRAEKAAEHAAEELARQEKEERESETSESYGSGSRSRSTSSRSTRGRRQSTSEAFIKSMARSFGTKVGTRLVKAIFGGIFRR